MFNSMYIYISVITLLVFATMNEGKLTKVEVIENSLSDARKQLHGIAQLIISREAAIKELKDKINSNETAETGNRTVENYISCWRKYYETYYGYVLFERAKNAPVDHGTFTVDHSLQQCFKEEANAREAQWQSVSAAVNCEYYKPSGKDKDLRELKSKIENSYSLRMIYGDTMLLTKIHESLIKKLTRVGGRN
ncbi:unnamed protein product [Trichobilharzia szidati]|nr:unnamed protein product [Trichobilharzia szidati]